jgi:hypothetical protein
LRSPTLIAAITLIVSHDLSPHVAHRKVCVQLGGVKAASSLP